MNNNEHDVLEGQFKDSSDNGSPIVPSSADHVVFVQVEKKVPVYVDRVVYRDKKKSRRPQLSAVRQFLEDRFYEWLATMLWILAFVVVMSIASYLMWYFIFRHMFLSSVP